MENLFGCECDLIDRASTTPTDPKDELLTCLTSFQHLYSQHEDDLQRTSNAFRQTAVRVREAHVDDYKHRMSRSMVGACGGTLLGGVFGAVCGGAGGVLGGIGAVALCDDINAVGAVRGFVGSVIGGTAGGMFCGAVGGATCAAVKVAGSSLCGDFCEVAWIAAGFAAGGAIGGIFGGRVGAAGGAAGGVLGALCGVSAATGVAGKIVTNYYQLRDNKEPNEQGKHIKEVEIIQKTGRDLCETIKPLEEELKTIKRICDNIGGGVDVCGVAEQTAKTLTALRRMESAVSGAQKAKNNAQAVSWIERVAKECTAMMEEFETMEEAVEKLLDSQKTC